MSLGEPPHVAYDLDHTRSWHLQSGLGLSRVGAGVDADRRARAVNRDGEVSRAVPSLRSLVGVGKKTEQKLDTLGVRTVGHLAIFDVQHLIEIFGRKLGTYFHNASLGIDDDPVEERSEPESVSRISTLKQDTRDLDVILKEAYRLCEDVHKRLLKQELMYRSVGIRVVASNLGAYSRSKTLENPQNDLETFKATVKELFEKFLDESDVEARRVGVRLSSLTKKEDMQQSLTRFFGGLTI